MNDDELDERPSSSTPDDRGAPRPPAPEIHREREVIVTDVGGRGSGPGTAIIVIFAFVALLVIGAITFAVMQRDGGGILPDELDINIELPEAPAETGGSSTEAE
jgi:hypothetical protein